MMVPSKYHVWRAGKRFVYTWEKVYMVSSQKTDEILGFNNHTRLGCFRIKSRVTFHSSHDGLSGKRHLIVQITKRKKHGYSVFPARINIPIVRSGYALLFDPVSMIHELIKTGQHTSSARQSHLHPEEPFHYSQTQRQRKRHRSKRAIIRSLERCLDGSLAANFQRQQDQELRTRKSKSARWWIRRKPPCTRLRPIPHVLREWDYETVSCVIWGLLRLKDISECLGKRF